MNSNAAFGSVYRLSGTTTPEVVIPTIVPTGVAVDNAGSIYVSTRLNNFGGFQGRSIYRFDASDSFSSATLVAQFDQQGVDELAFDDLGRLYAVSVNADDLSTTQTSIIQLTHLTQVPEPGSLALLMLGLAGLAAGRRKVRR